jgi:hypothetical protein
MDGYGQIIRLLASYYLRPHVSRYWPSISLREGSLRALEATNISTPISITAQDLEDSLFCKRLYIKVHKYVSPRPADSD